jgi:hypothetical protein
MGNIVKTDGKSQLIVLGPTGREGAFSSTMFSRSQDIPKCPFEDLTFQHENKEVEEEEQAVCPFHRLKHEQPRPESGKRPNEVKINFFEGSFKGNKESQRYGLQAPDSEPAHASLRKQLATACRNII